MRAVIITLMATCAVGCQADRPGGNKPDAAPDITPLNAPMIDGTTPMATPNDTVAVRGKTDGSRLIIQGGAGDPVVKAVLPSGDYCVDVPLNPTGPTMLTAFALKDGLISPPSTITVTKNPSAAIPSMPLCLGMEQPVCVAEDAAHSDCTNGKDDNCNGYIDKCDPSCNGCVEDALGPNWVPFFVPMVPAGTYRLQICPCRVDWFAFHVTPGDTVHVKATFDSTKVDIDLKLMTAAAAENNTGATVAASVTTTGIEQITWLSNATGTYYLEIYPFKADGVGAYTLTIY